MSSVTTLARPYAKAAFDLAQAEQNLAGWDKMLNLASRIAADEAFSGLLDNPLISSAEVAALITETAGAALDERFGAYLGVLAENDRLSLLPDIERLFRVLREDAEKRLRVRVISAVSLDDEQSGRLQEALARRFERTVELESVIDEGVIGGAVIYAGDEVIDGSLRGRLQKLSSSLAS